MPVAYDADEEVVAPTKLRDKRKSLEAELPRIEVLHELLDRKLTCACGCHKQVISEETSEQLDIMPMHDPGDQTYPQSVRLPRLRDRASHRRQTGSVDPKEYGQPERFGHVVDDQICGRPTTALRDGTQPARHQAITPWRCN